MKHENYFSKITTCLVILLSLISFVSCQDEPANHPEKNTDDTKLSISIDDLIGKCIRWDEYNSEKQSTGYDTRVKFDNKTDISTNFSDFGTYVYKQISDTECHINFAVPQRAGSTTSYFQYDITLSFYSATEFKLKGNKTINRLSGPNAGKTENVSIQGNGHFVKNLFSPDDYIPSDKDETKPGNDSSDNDGNNSGDFVISKPTVEEIGENSAVIKGTILGNANFKSRGIAYGTAPNPTTGYVVNNDIINYKLTLESGTKYYVRLFARVNDQTFYGEEISFTTAGTPITDFSAVQTFWSDTYVKISIVAPSSAKKYGLCWATHENPEIADKFLKEEEFNSSINHTDIWQIDNLERGRKYYVRPYHMEGSKVVYYSQFSVAPLGSEVDITYSFSYADLNFQMNNSYWGEIAGWDFNVNWKGLPGNGNYNLTSFWSSYSPTAFNQFTPSSEIISANGSKRYVEDKVCFYDNVSGRKTASYGGYVAIQDQDNNVVAISFYEITGTREIRTNLGADYKLEFTPYKRGSIFFDPLREKY